MARLNDMEGARSALGLDREVLLTQARFYAAYAANLERDRYGDVRQSVWARISNPSEAWLGRAIIASTYRTAAQYAALADLHLAATLMLRASWAYLDAGVPFGLFLATGIADYQVLTHPQVQRNLTSQLSLTSPELFASDPVQQTYLLLTLASQPWLQPWSEQRPTGLLEQLTSHELHPVGAQSVPLTNYLDIARIMLAHQRDDARDDASLTRPGADDEAGRLAEEVAPHLAAMAGAQAGSLRVSQRNHYLWQNAAAPVNIVDLEQVALCALAAKTGQRRSSQVLNRAVGLLEDDEDVLAQLPLWLATEMATLMREIPNEATEILSRSIRYQNDDR